jgi:hypothetical protein
MHTDPLKSDGGRFWSRWGAPLRCGDPLEKQYQGYRAVGKERMLTVFLVVMSILTLAQVPFFKLEDPVQVFRMGSLLVVYIYTCLLRTLFHFFPALTHYWDYFVVVGATHMIISYSLSRDRVAKFLGDRYLEASCEHEISSQVSIAAVLLGVGLLLKIQWQFFACLAVLAPSCYFLMGTIFGCLGCENGDPDLEMGAVHLMGLGLMILVGVVLHERDRRRLWDSCRNASLLMARLKVAHSLRERLLRAVFDVSFAAQVLPSGDLQVVGEWPALDDFIGRSMMDSKMSSHMPSVDRARFFDYVRRAMNNTDEAIPACLLSVHFEPEPGCSLAANMYIVSTAEDPVLTVCLSTSKGSEAPEFHVYDTDLAACKKGGAVAAAEALAAHIKKMPPGPQRPALPSLHSAPTELHVDNPEARLLTACEDDCLRPDCVAWVEGHLLPQPLRTLCPGQKVLCHDNMSKGMRYVEIQDCKVENGSAKWVSVVLEDGTSLQMTANHPVQPLAGECTSDAPSAVRAADLCAGSDYLMVLKTMPVLVEDVFVCESSECDDRVFLTLHQPQRHSVFVAAPSGDGVPSPVVQTMAVGSADVRPQYNDLPVKNTFIDIPSTGSQALKRSNSAPPGFRVARVNPPTVSSAPPSSYASSISGSSMARSSQDGDVLVAPPMQPVWQGAGAAQLSLQPRGSAESVALSEVMSLRSVNVRSIGSLDHTQGNCKACLFANRADHAGGGACWKGIFCERCHEPHDPLARRKPKTGRQRERAKLQLMIA